MIYFNSEKKSPLLAFIKSEPTFLTGSLAVWNALGFAFHFARPSIPSRAQRGEDRIPFELFQEYTAHRRGLERNAGGFRTGRFRKFGG